MKTELLKYIRLITDFTEHKINTETFEKEYLNMVKQEEFLFNDLIAEVIETLFSDVDAYCGDTKIADYDISNPFRDIDDRELQKRAKKALDKLKEFI